MNSSSESNPSLSEYSLFDGKQFHGDFSDAEYRICENVIGKIKKFMNDEGSDIFADPVEFRNYIAVHHPVALPEYCHNSYRRREKTCELSVERTSHLTNTMLKAGESVMQTITAGSFGNVPNAFKGYKQLVGSLMEMLSGLAGKKRVDVSLSKRTSTLDFYKKRKSVMVFLTWSDGDVTSTDAGVIFKRSYADIKVSVSALGFEIPLGMGPETIDWIY